MAKTLHLSTSGGVEVVGLSIEVGVVMSPLTKAFASAGSTVPWQLPRRDGNGKSRDLLGGLL